MLFLMAFGRFPEKFSLGIFFSPSKPNTIRLSIDVRLFRLMYVMRYASLRDKNGDY